MKKIITFLLTFFIISLYKCNVYSQPDINANSALIANAETVQIVYEKNIEDSIYPAGFTKFMTALVVYEKIGKDTTVTTPADIKDHYTPADYSIASEPGEVFKSGDLLNALIISSANDAAYTLAVSAFGTEEKCVEAMNKKAKELNLNKTNFVNVTGNHSSNQVSSPVDILKLYREILANKFLCESVSRRFCTIEPTNIAPKRTLWSSNHFVSNYYNTNYYDPNISGGKSTWSEAGGYSLIANGNKNGVNIICMVFNSSDKDGKASSFNDVRNLFDYCFDNYKKKIIVKIDDLLYQPDIKNASGKKHVLLHADRTVSALMRKDDEVEDTIEKQVQLDEIYAPIKPDESLGIIKYTYFGKDVGYVNLISKDEIKANYLVWLFRKIGELFSSKALRIFISIIIAVILLYNVFIKSQKRKQKKKQRKYNNSRR